MANNTIPFKDLPDNILFNYNDFKGSTAYTDSKLYDPLSQNTHVTNSSLINPTHLKTFRPSSIRRRITRDRLGMQDKYTY